MFKLDDAILKFSTARGFCEFFELERLFDGKFADGSARNFSEVRAHPELFAHFLGKGADVGAGRALDDEASEGSVDFREAKFEHFDFYRLQFDGLVSASQFVSGTAVNLFCGEGGRHLREAADAFVGKFFESGAIERGSGVGALRLAFGVVSIGGEAEAEAGGVAFAAAGIKLDEAGGAPEEQDEDAGGERVERSEMSDLTKAGEMANGVDDVMRGLAWRLVDDERAVEGSGL